VTYPLKADLQAELQKLRDEAEQVQQQPEPERGKRQNRLLVSLIASCLNEAAGSQPPM
jgi:hypothetical protein